MHVKNIIINNLAWQRSYVYEYMSSITPFNIVNTESLYCIQFQSNEQISQLIIQIPTYSVQTATYDMYLMTTKQLCDHRNCTVEMIIEPMKNPVNHKQQGMLGTVQIQDVFCRKCIKQSCRISTQTIMIMLRT